MQFNSSRSSTYKSTGEPFKAGYLYGRNYRGEKQQWKTWILHFTGPDGLISGPELFLYLNGSGRFKTSHLVPHWDASTLPNPAILHKKIKREYFRDTSDWARLSQRSWRQLHSKLALWWNHDCCKFPLGRTQRNSWTCFIRQFSPLSVDYQFVISSADSQFLILVYVPFPLVTSATFIDKLAKRLWKSVCA